MPRFKRTNAQIKEDIERQAKVCSKCRELKPFSEYTPSPKKVDGVHPSCRECKHGLAREYRRTGARRETYLKWKYGISPDEYEKRLASQGGGCAICGLTAEEESHYTVLPVDHCHKTGVVRGLLCANCNRALGLLADDPERMLAAAHYLQESK